MKDFLINHNLNNFFGAALLCILISLNTGAQTNHSMIQDSSLTPRLSAEQFDQYLKEFGKNKILPPGYEQQALIALSHFPELKDTHITFRLHSSHATLKTRLETSTFFSNKSKRLYTITISTKTKDVLEPVTFSHMSFDAQIGILGHEISHVLDFSKKNFWQASITGVNHLSASYVDSLEYNTDKIAIEHGLGPQLKAWSSFIRTTMNVKYWRGADYVKHPENQHERYMNPDTIDRWIETLEHTPKTAEEKK